MNSIRHSASILILSLTAAVAGHAMAAEPASLTRAQVFAELEQARANGELFEPITGERMRDLRPDLYPAKAVQGQALTREEVLAQTQKARDAGLLTFGEER